MNRFLRTTIARYVYGSFVIFLLAQRILGVPSVLIDQSRQMDNEIAGSVVPPCLFSGPQIHFVVVFRTVGHSFG